MKDKIINEHSIFWTDSNNILYCQFINKDSNYRFNSEKVELFKEAITKLCKGTAMPFIIDARHSTGTFLSSAAKLFATSPELNKLRISEAFILNSLGMKLLIASYKRIYEPLTPFAVFKDMDSAKDYSIDRKHKFYGSM